MCYSRSGCRPAARHYLKAIDPCRPSRIDSTISSASRGTRLAYDALVLSFAAISVTVATARSPASAASGTPGPGPCPWCCRSGPAAPPRSIHWARLPFPPAVLAERHRHADGNAAGRARTRHHAASFTAGWMARRSAAMLAGPAMHNRMVIPSVLTSTRATRR